MQQGQVQQGSYTLELDASRVDIYKGTNAVIFTMDPTKKWTWDYIKTELPKIPEEMFILIVASVMNIEQHF